MTTRQLNYTPFDDSGRKMILLLISFILLIGVSLPQEFTNLKYSIEEETGKNVVIGNTARDSGLFQSTGNDFSLLSFKPLAEGNAHVQYVDVDESIGVIRTAKNIDREVLCQKSLKCQLQFDIGVYKGSLLTLLRITVDVLDINDNSPTFPREVVNLSVPENQEINFPLYTSVATDADAVGVNSTITYRLARRTDLFELSKIKTSDGLEDLVITIKKVLDREDKKLYPLTVIATDLGEDPRSGSVLINIQVADMNDNDPVFGKSNYTVRVLENVDIKEPIMILSASDKDDGPNADLNYELSTQVSQDIRKMFSVQPTTGKIYARQKLDYETRALYQFYVKVQDNGSPPKDAFSYVTIQLIDVNDNPPVISVNKPGAVTIIENGSVDKFLAHIKVVDADTGNGGQVSCSISDPHFILKPYQDASLGVFEIRLKQPLDREEDPTVDVTVMCSDEGVPSLSAFQSFEVQIKDVNDNAPEFIESTFSSVMENGDDDEFVMQVIADDPDEGENARVTYEITSNKDTHLFSIDPISGYIRTKTSLNRELKSEYKLEITATDHGKPAKSSTTTVTIIVLDENDNPPKFTQQAFTASVMENLPVGSPVGDVAAYDEDSKNNGLFQFSIMNRGPGAADGQQFTIDDATGVIKTNKEFDREDRSQYVFRVKVADSNVKNFYDIANVTVTITDANDHNPVVILPVPSERTFVCPFNMTVGTIITTVEAEDEDTAALTQFSFELLHAHPAPKKPLFSIDGNSGKLRLARQISPEDIEIHTMDVKVRDGTGPDSRSTIFEVTLDVQTGSEAEMKAYRESLKKSKSGSSTNMMIIIIIIAVTIILAIVIVGVICLVRRSDKKRHPTTRAAENGVVVDSKLYQAAQWVSSVSIPNEMGPEDNVKATLEVPGADMKKKKKEVSFSLDDEVVVESPDTSGSMGSVFAPSPNTIQKENGRPHKTGTIGSNGGFIMLNGMASPDYSKHLYEQRTSSTDAPDERQFIEVSRPGEDRYSDASSGDTGTSDSGRGGSEDESHAHTISSGEGDPQQKPSPGTPSSSGFGSFRGPADTDPRRYHGRQQQQQQQQQLHYTSDSDHIPGSPTPMLEEYNNQQQHLAGNVQSYHSPHHPHPHPHPHHHHLQQQHPAGGSLRSLSGSPSPSNLQYSNSTRSINSPGNNTLINAPPPPAPPSHTNARLTLSMNDCEGPFRVKKQEQHQQLLKTFSSPRPAHSPNHLSSNSHPAWRRAKGLDTSYRSGSQSTYREEDDNTTTSGSYIINPDELGEDNMPYDPDIMV